MSRLRPVNEQCMGDFYLEISHQDQGKEPKEIYALLSKAKIGDLYAINNFKKIDSRLAGLFSKVRHNSNMKEMEQHYINQLKSWIVN